jgi:DNA-binding SARP family transcriptional activator
VQPSPSIKLRLLGRTDLETPNADAADDLLAQPRPTALLIYLALAKPGALLRRDRLIGLFWAETDQQGARANLRRLVHTIRKALGDDLIITRGDEEIGLAANSIWCDAVEFESAFNAGRPMRALELYEGDLLPSFYVSGAAGFEQWLEGTRTRFADMAAAAAWSVAQHSAGQNKLTDASRWARRSFEFSPDNERRVRSIIELLVKAGDRAGALRLYDEFCRHLKQEYDALPSPETRALIESVKGT